MTLDLAQSNGTTTNGYRPMLTRPEAEQPMPLWPVTLMIAAYPLWFVTGLSGFTWVIFALPMAATLVRRRNIVLPKSFGLWCLFLLAVVGSVISIDSADRMAGWILRFGYYISASVMMIYVLNGRGGVPVWKVIRAFTWLWIATVVGGYLAFLLGDLDFRSPMFYLMPGALRSNDLINSMIVPGFADLQDIIGFPVPRPKAPFPYTNTWGSMLALLTPFGLIALGDRRVGFSSRTIRFVLAASVVPAVISLNRGLWLSLGVGLAYAAVRLGLTQGSRAIRNAIVVAAALAFVYTATPLGDLIATRVETGHSNTDRLELITDAIDGTIERPLFGWGAPRPNDRNLPSVGTHGQTWFVMFSYGFVGLVGYLGFLAASAWHTRKQTTSAGLWAHVVILIGITQMFFYLHVPQQMFTILVAIAVALRLQSHGDKRLASPDD